MKWGWQTASRDLRARTEFVAWEPLSEVAPYLATGLLFLLLYILSAPLTSAKGVLFDLPAMEVVEDMHISLAALVLPTAHETLVFFDDARYIMEDESSMDAFAGQLADRLSAAEAPALLVLADKRVKSGELMRLAELAKRSGVQKILFAAKNDTSVGDLK